jgi:hypothetical protein
MLSWAPERIATMTETGGGAPTKSADIYSFGVLIFQVHSSFNFVSMPIIHDFIFSTVLWSRGAILQPTLHAGDKFDDQWCEAYTART